MLPCRTMVAMRGLFDEFDQTVWLTGDMEGKYPKADQYLSLVKSALMKLLLIYWIILVTVMSRLYRYVRRSPAKCRR